MGELLTFYAIKKEDLPKVPKGVRKFIDDFFEEQKMFGIDCYVAIDSDYKSPWNELSEEEERKYEDGLSQKELDRCGIFTWMGNNPQIIFKYDWS